MFAMRCASCNTRIARVAGMRSSPARRRAPTAPRTRPTYVGMFRRHAPSACPVGMPRRHAPSACSDDGSTRPIYARRVIHVRDLRGCAARAHVARCTPRCGRDALLVAKRGALRRPRSPHGATGTRRVPAQGRLARPRRAAALRRRLRVRAGAQTRAVPLGYPRTTLHPQYRAVPPQHLKYRAVPPQYPTVPCSTPHYLHRTVRVCKLRRNA